MRGGFKYTYLCNRCGFSAVSSVRGIVETARELHEKPGLDIPTSKGRLEHFREPCKMGVTSSGHSVRVDIFDAEEEASNEA